MLGELGMFPMTHKILFVELIGSCLKTIKIGEIGLILKEAWTSQRHNYLQQIFLTCPLLPEFHPTLNLCRCLKSM